MILKILNKYITINIKPMKFEYPKNQAEFQAMLHLNDLNPNQLSKLCGIHHNILYRYYNGEVKKPSKKNMDIIVETINNYNSQSYREQRFKNKFNI